MPPDATFLADTESLRLPGMGTEHAAWMLYTLVRMLRPERILEIGAGYSTLFILRALADNLEEIAADRSLVEENEPLDETRQQRRSLLVPREILRSYRPRLLSIDDLSVQPSSAERVTSVAARLGLDNLLDFRMVHYRQLIETDLSDWIPFDLIWLDAGSPADDAEFLAALWPKLREDHGWMVLHEPYWTVPVLIDDGIERVRRLRTVPGSILNEVKRQLAMEGTNARFEVCSILERYKHRQNGLLLLHRLPSLDMTRDVDFHSEISNVLGAGDYATFRLATPHHLSSQRSPDTEGGHDD